MESPWFYHTAGEWNFRARQRAVGGWYGEAKRESFVDSRGGFWEPGPLWFQFAETKDDVLRKLKAEVFN
ncbi:hypothetical protein LCM4573_21255 [Rhizobium sp. LCM 4573]|nr:hypothetical protein LCM4573_21255 [Rhizobium sp. LCM 4573]